MGGDDLGSDDEYLSKPSKGATGASVDYDVEDSQKDQKRKRNNDDDDNVDNSNGGVKQNDSAKEEEEKQQRKKKKGGGPMRVLGTNIRMESIESKAEILSKYADTEFKPIHMAKQSSKSDTSRLINKNDNNLDSNNFMDRLLCLISKKQIKIKQQQKSPRAVIVCISARRCVEVLKDLAPLKLRVAKLFPKQGTIGEQSKQLETTVCGIAVGTPHRVKELIEKGSLNLKNTQLLGLDTFQNPKNFSVYTLPDTAPFIQSILKDHAQPVCCSGRKDLKIGFV
jgi:hypothetical protein